MNGVKRFEELTAKQNAFCWHYINNGENAMQAYREAGYQASTDGAAANGGSRMLLNANVQNKLMELKQAVVVAQGITAEKVAAELAKIAFSSVTDFATIDDAIEVNPDDPKLNLVYRNVTIKKTSEMSNVAAIAGIKQGRHGIEIKLWDKPKALELLARYLKMFAPEGESLVDKELADVDYTKLSSSELHTLYLLTNKAKAQ